MPGDPREQHQPATTVPNEANASTPHVARAFSWTDETEVPHEIMEDLRSVGYSPETVALVPFMPLLHVAWADGEISNGERAMILSSAATRDIEWEGRAHRQLLEWIAHPPSPEFFVKSLRAIRFAWRAVPVEKRATLRRSLIASCIRVAEASAEGPSPGTEISEQEQGVLDWLRLELQRPDDPLMTERGTEPTK